MKAVAFVNTIPHFHIHFLEGQQSSDINISEIGKGLIIEAHFSLKLVLREFVCDLMKDVL
jgi:hypothetical protein